MLSARVLSVWLCLGLAFLLASLPPGGTTARPDETDEDAGKTIRLSSRRFLTLSRWPTRSGRRSLVLICSSLWHYLGCMETPVGSNDVDEIVVSERPLGK